MARTRTPFVVTGFPALAKAITPSNVTQLLDYDNRPVAMTVYVGVEGDVAVVPVGNTVAQPVTFKVPAGGLIPVEVTWVLATGTTANGLVGLY